MSRRLWGGLKRELFIIRYVEGQVGEEKSNTEDVTAIVEGLLVEDNSIRGELLREVDTRDNFSEEISGVIS